MTALLRFSIAILALSFLLPATTDAKPKPKDDPKHENHYEDIAPLELDDIRIAIFKQHSQMEFALFKAKFENETSDFLVIRKEAPVFIFDFGNHQPFDGDRKKPIIIKPEGKASHTYKVTGGADFHVAEFSVEMKGFMRAPLDGKPHQAPDFQLPAAANNFDAGPFACKLLGVKQETKETVAKFECKYKGKEIGFVDSSRLSFAIENGQKFANQDRKAGPRLMFPGDSIKFNAVAKIPAKVVDMQFATLQVVWGESFIESKLVPIEVPTLEFELDAAKTAEAND